VAVGLGINLASFAKVIKCSGNDDVVRGSVAVAVAEVAVWQCGCGCGLMWRWLWLLNELNRSSIERDMGVAVWLGGSVDWDGITLLQPKHSQFISIDNMFKKYPFPIKNQSFSHQNRSFSHQKSITCHKKIYKFTKTPICTIKTPILP
jgi:hypothetical protein